MTTSCCGNTRTQSCGCSSQPDARQSTGTFRQVSALNTLAFNAALCTNCGTCISVCPHGVFAPAVDTGLDCCGAPGAGEGARLVVRVVRAGACMECGACALNCPAGALRVDSGVGCAAAMIGAALRGSDEVTCGCDDEPRCC